MQRTTFVFILIFGLSSVLSACHQESHSETDAPEIAETNVPEAVSVVQNEPEVKATPVVQPEKKASEIEKPKSTKTVIKEKSTVIEKPAPAVEEVEEEISEEVIGFAEEKEEIVPPVVEEEKPEEVIFNHDTWNHLLQSYVSSTGKVNYEGFRSSAAEFESYLNDLANNPPNASWSREKTMAYWINAYNAFTIKLIVDYYPVRSIKEIHNGNPWDVRWIKIGGKTYTLNNIENDILRPKYKDARIHFAVNCAAYSCPPLANKAFTEQNLNSLLEQQTKQFVNNAAFNSISANSVQVSRIFEWYASDFGDLITYLNKYSNTKIAAGTKVDYKEYDWKLNK